MKVERVFSGNGIYEVQQPNVAIVISYLEIFALTFGM